MKKEQLLKILSNIDNKASIYLDCLDSTELNEVLVEEWKNGLDVYLTDNAQKHIDYCEELHGLLKAYAYYVDNNEIKVKNIDYDK